MWFGYKGTDIYIALNAGFFLNVQQKVYDDAFLGFFFCLGKWKSNHKIKFSLVPAAFFCLCNDVHQVLGVDFLVQPQLPGFFRCFNGKCQSALSYFGKLFQNGKRK